MSRLLLLRNPIVTSDDTKLIVRFRFVQIRNLIMGSIPGLAFKTDVQDEDIVDDIIEQVAEEFDRLEYDEDIRYLYIEDDIGGKINCANLSGGNQYVGVSNEGLAFGYLPKEWPEWESYAEAAELMISIQNFIKEEFPHVEVDDLLPTMPIK